MSRLALLLLPAGLLVSCVKPCPEGTIQDDENKVCIRDDGGDAEADADTDADSDADTDADSDADTDADSDADTDADTDADLPAGALDAELIIGDLFTGRMQSWRAFSHEDGGVLLVFMSSNPDATCAKAATHLSGSGEPADDPSVLFAPDSCALVLRLTNPSFTWTESNPLDVSDLTDALVNAECTFGAGTWERVDQDGELGWFWRGEGAAYYTATATEGTIDSGSRDGGGGHTLTVNLDAYRGRFPYDAALGEAVARGSGKGAITAAACPALGDTPYFD